MASHGSPEDHIGACRLIGLALEFIRPKQLLTAVGGEAGDLRKGLVLNDDSGGTGALIISMDGASVPVVV